MSDECCTPHTVDAAAWSADGVTKVCQEVPCPPYVDEGLHRTWRLREDDQSFRVEWCALHPMPGVKCPMCHQPAHAAEAQVHYEPYLQARPWWRRAAARLARRPAWGIPETRRRESDRVVEFGPCGCVWLASDHPWMNLVVAVTSAGTLFRMEARSRYDTRATVRVQNAEHWLRDDSADAADDECDASMREEQDDAMALAAHDRDGD